MAVAIDGNLYFKCPGAGVSGTFPVKNCREMRSRTVAGARVDTSFDGKKPKKPLGFKPEACKTCTYWKDVEAGKVPTMTAIQMMGGQTLAVPKAVSVPRTKKRPTHDGPETPVKSVESVARKESVTTRKAPVSLARKDYGTFELYARARLKAENVTKSQLLYEALVECGQPSTVASICDMVGVFMRSEVSAFLCTLKTSKDKTLIKDTDSGLWYIPAWKDHRLLCVVQDSTSSKGVSVNSKKGNKGSGSIGSQPVTSTIDKEKPPKGGSGVQAVKMDPETRAGVLERDRIISQVQQKDEPGKKWDSGKPRYELLPGDVLELAAEIFTQSCSPGPNGEPPKYDARNWERGISWGRVMGALMRHLADFFWFRKELDTDSGKPLMGHVVCCAMMLCAYQLRKMKKFDDRPRFQVDEDESVL